MIKVNNKQYKIKSFAWDTNNDIRLKHLRELDMSISNIAQALGCSEGIVQRRLRVLNMSKIKWTTVQDGALRQHYETMSKKELATMLKVDEMAVKDRCSYLGLFLPRKGRPKQNT